MPEFRFPVDIGNRALQHCGVPLMDPAAGFNEASERAQHCGFLYGKLRQAELRRNVWRFAIKRAVLRAIDTNTLLISPSLWSSSATYFLGSIVADGSGNLWISNSRNNLGNSPGPPSVVWDPYYGPMTVMVYDGSQSYFTGELVYITAGDGTFAAFLSLVNSNNVHPAIPNQWGVNTIYSQGDVVQQFPAWAVGTTYSRGQGVLYTDGFVYVSLTAGNLGNTPSTSTAFWSRMPTLTILTQMVPVLGGNAPIVPAQSSPISEWQETSTTYQLGQFAIFNATVYMSIANNNLGNFPNVGASAFWVAVSNATTYQSLINLNLGNNPATTFVAPWSSITTYAINNTATGTDGFIYKSKVGGNINNNPVLDAGANWTNTGVLSPWQTSFQQGIGNSQWMQIGGSAFPFGVGLVKLDFIYPVGAGPSSQSATRNVFRLPANYLRAANQDQKAGSMSSLGAPAGLTYKDWLFEDQIFVSREVNPIIFHFIADIVDVTKMDPMYCEGLAARIALEGVEVFTQSSSKHQQIKADYELFMREARLVNAIEVGAEEPPEDDYITCRW